jgi:hypothetical protein
MMGALVAPATMVALSVGALSVGALSVGVWGCAANELAPMAEDVGVPGDGASIYFEHEGTLTLAPAEAAQVTVIGKPARRYAIAFLLVGDAGDASLDLTQVVADDNGRATVTLRAPTSATYFAVRATIKDGASAQLNVAVSDQGFGDLLIEPDYSGKRDTREWVASVSAGTTCAALVPTFPQDPEGPAPVSAPPGEPLLIEDVPVGPTLAVFVRGGHYMWGCTDVTDLLPGAASDVSVKVVDKPLDLSQAELDVLLGVEPDPNEWPALVSSEQQALLAAFTGGLPEAEMLLAAMQQTYAGDPQEFDSASAGNGWLVALQAHLSAGSVDLSGTIGALMGDGLAAEPPEIRAHLTSVEGDDDHALLELLSIGSATPEVMHVPAEYVMSFTADTQDIVRVSGTLFWMPSRYFGHVATEAALAAHPGAVEMADALAAVAQCSTLALEGLAACDATCIAALCRDALGARWQLALASSAERLAWGELPMESGGEALFDDEARAVGFNGSWIGRLQVADKSAKVTGAATAETPTTP